jgi:hypothetical protein
VYVDIIIFYIIIIIHRRTGRAEQFVCRDDGFRTGCGGPREPDRRRPETTLWGIMNEMGVAPAYRHTSGTTRTPPLRYYRVL